MVEPQIDLVSVLTKLKSAVDLMRDVRPHNPQDEVKAKSAIASVESAISDIVRAR